MFKLACAVSVLALVTIAPPAKRADACGGCFSPPETVTSVESHRMVVSLSLSKTILFDQIRYTGAPEDFVWVLPVPDQTATIEIADDELFNQLERQTAPQISAPTINFPPLDCGDSWGGGASTPDGGPTSDAGVDVYREEVVGPYETVLIGSESATALVDWLTANGYQVPDSTTPVIQHYADLSSKFIVLRLAPDQGVSAMQPVRVEFPGFMSTFPLKMVTVGASGTLTMTLWVVADQRYEPMNYGAVEIAPGDLTWDYSRGRSDYGNVMADKINDAGGKAWITQYANPLNFLWIDSPDVDIATQGIEYPYLTRLHTEMLTDHLDTDMVLGPSAGQAVDNAMFVTNTINAPEAPTCPPGSPGADGSGPRFWGCSAAGGSGTGAVLLLLVLAFAMRQRRQPRGASR